MRKGRPPPRSTSASPRRFELGGEADQGIAQVLGVAGSGDRGHGGDLGDPHRRREDRGAAQAVSDQETGRLALPPQEVRGCDEVVQVGREVGLGEVPLALADAGEVEPEHRDLLGGQGSLIQPAALWFLEQVKQWQKIA